MPPGGPVSRRKLIASLRRLGFSGPFSGGRHHFMVRDDRVLTIPIPTQATSASGSSAAILAKPA